MFSVCQECGKDCDTITSECDGNNDRYCFDCWEIDILKSFRCYSFAIVYDATSGERLSFAGSIYDSCAERRALWKLDNTHMSVPKVIIVGRIRKNRNDKKISFGNSKPCHQCIIAMQMYNVVRVYYSFGKQLFMRSNVSEMSNSYTTESDIIISL